MNSFPEDLSAWVRDYRNPAVCDDRVHREFTLATAINPLLAPHSLHIEQHKLGFTHVLNVGYNRVFE